MQGEIIMILKFRAWDKREKKMWTPGITKDGLPFVQHPISQIVVVMDGELLDPIMQFTGLTDATGKDWYLSDILELDCTAPDEHYTATGVIEYCDQTACFRVRDSFGEFDRLEDWIDAKVIGNIHQHSHLLEGENNHEQ